MTLRLLQIYFFLLPLQIALRPLAGFDIALVRILAPLIFLWWLFDGLTRKRLRIPASPSFAFFVSFLFFAALSLFFATEPFWGMRKLLFLLSFFPLWFVIADTLDTPTKLQTLLKSLSLGSTFAACVGIAQFLLQLFLPVGIVLRFWTDSLLPIFLGPAFAESVAKHPSLLVNIAGNTWLRATALFPDPHVASFYFGLTAPIAIGLALSQRSSSSRYFWLICAAIILIADILTFSRGGYLGLIAATLFFLFSQRRALKPKQQLLSFFLVISVFFAALFSPVGSRLRDAFNLHEGSNLGRIEMWQAAVHTIAQNRLLGAGLGNFPLEVLPSASYRDPIYAHNLWLDLAAETGLLGCLAFLAAFLFAFIRFKASSRTCPSSKWITLSFIIFIIHSLVETPIYSVHILSILMLLCGISEPIPRKKVGFE